jgi:hypothetical protein
VVAFWVVVVILLGIGCLKMTQYAFANLKYQDGILLLGRTTSFLISLGLVVFGIVSGIEGLKEFSWIACFLAFLSFTWAITIWIILFVQWRYRRRYRRKVHR